jgi:CRISPR/Cas system CSM-associated protein Csm3 (group 7 of RAMP superfamily)
MNPYGFVRLAGNGPERKGVQEHQQYNGLSGRIACTLTTRTALFIPKYRGGRADNVKTHEPPLPICANRVGVPIIPGTSLKGVIRNVAEAAANACFTLPNQLLYEKRTLEYDLPAGFRTCQDHKNLCPTCRLFGMLNRREVFAGNVSVQDATAQPGYQTQCLTLAILSGPKPRHKPFYSTDPTKPKPPIRGRKFYYHHQRADGLPRQRREKDGQNKTADVVMPGAVFQFEVDFENVAENDLNLLLFALMMWEDTCHKVGMGKPIGLGSAKIEIASLTVLDRNARYHQLGGGWEQPLTGPALADFLTPRLAPYQNSVTDNLQDLHRILRWDPNAPDNIQYPDQQWFKDNPKTPLEKAP